jgi:hypothetical protein
MKLVHQTFGLENWHLSRDQPCFSQLNVDLERVVTGAILHGQKTSGTIWFVIADFPAPGGPSMATFSLRGSDPGFRIFAMATERPRIEHPSRKREEMRD